MRGGLRVGLVLLVRQTLSFAPSFRPRYSIGVTTPAPSLFRHNHILQSSNDHDSSDNDTEEVETIDKKLYEIARRLKLEIFDLEEGIFGFDSQDPVYGE